ncbi:MAG: hypothetical protein AAF741_18825 [Bacteroidota bacterium]
MSTSKSTSAAELLTAEERLAVEQLFCIIWEHCEDQLREELAAEAA